MYIYLKHLMKLLKMSSKQGINFFMFSNHTFKYNVFFKHKLWIYRWKKILESGFLY